MPSVAPGQAFGARGPRSTVVDLSPVHVAQQRGASQLTDILQPDAVRAASRGSQNVAPSTKQNVAVERAVFKEPARDWGSKEPEGSSLRRTLERVVISKDNNTRDSPRLGAYTPSAQASWARERLLGTTAPPVEDEAETADLEARTRRAQANAWYAQPTLGVDTSAVDALEETMRKKLGLLVNQLGSSPRAARALFGECDSAKGGRVERTTYVDVMSRKLNYDFPARGALPSSREALEALYDRYDLDRTGAPLGARRG